MFSNASTRPSGTCKSGEPVGLRSGNANPQLDVSYAREVLIKFTLIGIADPGHQLPSVFADYIENTLTQQVMLPTSSHSGLPNMRSNAIRESPPWAWVEFRFSKRYWTSARSCGHCHSYRHSDSVPNLAPSIDNFVFSRVPKLRSDPPRYLIGWLRLFSPVAVQVGGYTLRDPPHRRHSLDHYHEPDSYRYSI